MNLEYGIVVAVFSMMCGCTSSSTLTRQVNEEVRISPEKKLTIILKDDTEIDVEPYRHIAVSDSSGFTYGYGTLFNPTSGVESTFTGTIYPVRVALAETSVFTGMDRNKGVRCYDFFLPDSSRVRFLAGDFVTVTRAGGPGFWCAGYGRIPFNEIVSIEEQKFSAGKTLLLVGAVAGTAAVIAVVAYANSIQRMNFDNMFSGVGK